MSLKRIGTEATLDPMLKKILLTIAILVPFTMLLVGWNVQAAQARWLQYRAQLIDAGALLTFDQIQAGRPVLQAKGDNVAARATDVARRLADVKGPTSRGVLNSTRELRIDFFEGIPARAIETTKAYMAPRWEVIRDLEGISNLQAGRFDIDYAGSELYAGPELYTGPDLEIGARFQQQAPPIGTLANGMFVQASLRLIDGEADAAAAVIPDILALASPLASEPAMQAYLSRVSQGMRASRLLEQTLRVDSLPAETLTAIDSAIHAFLKDNTLTWALRGQRAVVIGHYDGIRSGVFVPGVSSIFAAYDDQRMSVERLTSLIKAADDLQALAAAVESVKAKRTDTDGLAGLSSLLSPNVVAAELRAHFYLLTELRAARMALAYETFRLENGDWPASPEDVVPDYLKARPTDPFDQLPMKIARREDRWVFYSVGRNGKDDGGHVASDKQSKRRLDVGFRLLDEEKRELLIVE